MKKPLRNFRWWYRGITSEGNYVNFDGTGEAATADEAIALIERIMRKDWPNVKWMHGDEIEGDGVSFGPTVQMGRVKK